MVGVGVPVGPLFAHPILAISLQQSPLAKHPLSQKQSISEHTLSPISVQHPVYVRLRFWQEPIQYMIHAVLCMKKLYQFSQQE